MHLNKIDLILNSKLSQRDLKLTPQQNIAVREAIVEYAIQVVDAYRSNEIKAVSLEAVKFFPSIIRGEIKMWLRKKRFQRAKRLAQERANLENRKMYCIRSSDIKYEILSTRDIEYNKKLQIFGKNVDFRMLSEMSDFIAFPIRQVP